jgi:hypothetical protein
MTESYCKHLRQKPGLSRVGVELDGHLRFDCISCAARRAVIHGINYADLHTQYLTADARERFESNLRRRLAIAKV